MMRRSPYTRTSKFLRPLVQRLEVLLPSAVPLLLRASLGITYVWFGGLKLAGEPTLPASLIAALTPSVDPDFSIPLVGAFEVVIGAGILIGRRMPIFLSAMALHLLGTFLVLLLKPELAFTDGNPMLLSVEGEYVIKNLVLLAATAALAVQWRTTRPAKGRGLRFARVGVAGAEEQTKSAA